MSLESIYVEAHSQMGVGRDKNEDDKHQLNGVVGLSGQQAASGPEEVSL